MITGIYFYMIFNFLIFTQWDLNSHLNF